MISARFLFGVTIAMIVCFSAHAASAPWAAEVQATPHDRRIDLMWERPEAVPMDGWKVWRGARIEGPFEQLRAASRDQTVCSDFIGENGREFFYRVTGIRDGVAVSTSAVVSARSREMNEAELLTSVEEATFRYFWQYAHPVSGLARESTTELEKVTIGGSGFGVLALLVGAERGFVSRAASGARLLRMLQFLEEKASRYHGVWPHWLDGGTGKTLSFSQFDDGGDLVETSYMMEGLLTARQYFDRTNRVEEEIRRRTTKLWQEVEWDWYLGEPKGQQLFWHWSPNHGWKMKHQIGGHFNECLITYLLAMASPAHPIPAACYTNGWAGPVVTNYLNGNSYFGMKQAVGWPMGGPLFFTHYSFLGFDPRPWSDPYSNFFENNRTISLIHHAYAVANPGKHKGYGEQVWGLTASLCPSGYRASEPRYDDGTVAPTAAISAMPYTPRESIGALTYYYQVLGKRLWGDFGFKDAFNLDRDWFADGYLAIDQGPMVAMIENYRTGLCWRLFMRNEEITRMLRLVGWHQEMRN